MVEAITASTRQGGERPRAPLPPRKAAARGKGSLSDRRTIHNNRSLINRHLLAPANPPETPHRRSETKTSRSACATNNPSGGSTRHKLTDAALARERLSLVASSTLDRPQREENPPPTPSPAPGPNRPGHPGQQYPLTRNTQEPSALSSHHPRPAAMLVCSEARSFFDPDDKQRRRRDGNPKNSETQSTPGSYHFSSGNSLRR
jgi:hypothetical protein